MAVPQYSGALIKPARFRPGHSIRNMRLHRSARTMMRLIASRFPDLMALVCGLLVLPWILGVPGHPDRLVELGWTIGLVAIVVYLVLYQIVKSLGSKGLFRSNIAVNRCLHRILSASAVIVTVVLAISAMLLFMS